MATAVHLPSPDSGAPLNEGDVGLVSPNQPGHSHSNSYSQRLPLNEFDLSDDRYPRHTSLKPPVSPTARFAGGVHDPAIDAGMTAALRASYEQSQSPGTSPPQKAWLGENIAAEPVDGWDPSRSGPTTAVLEAQSSGAGLTSPADGNAPVGSYFPDLPAANGSSNDPSADPRRQFADLPRRSPDMGQRSSSARPNGDQYDSNASGSPRNANLSLPPGVGPNTPVLSSGAASSPRHPSLPAAGIGAGPSSSGMSPIVPLSAGPTYNPTAMQIPISPKPRAYAQHPTYITPASAPAMQPSFSPPQVPKEEICVECAMRDQDMADVDVTSPGVWDRESDVLYEELCRREAEEEASGPASSDSHHRPRARGGKLTEENLKFWLSIVRHVCSLLAFTSSHVYRTPRSPLPVNRPWINMSSHNVPSLRQTLWPVHGRCASLAYWTRRCEIHSHNSADLPTSSATVRNLRTTLVRCASSPHVSRQCPRRLARRKVTRAKSRFWRME